MSAPLLQVLGALLIACVPIGIIIYARLLRHLREKGGRVQTAAVAIPDGLLASFLFLFLAMQTVLVITRGDAEPAPKITFEKVLPSALFCLGALALLITFLQVRGVELRRFFGLQGMRGARAAILAVGLIFALFPILLVIGAAANAALGAEAQEQELIGIFRETFIESDYAALALLAVVAAISQPLVEEVFFRGYFYVVGKRYLGALASAVATSLLFAAVHFNAAAFPALVVLALAFTLAYEVTGTILVPIVMHATFNSAQLALLAWQAHGIPSP